MNEKIVIKSKEKNLNKVLNIKAPDCQNVSCFVFEQSIMYHKAARQAFTMYTISKRCHWVFLMQSKSNQALGL